MPADQRGTAYHEAGHAVAAIALERGFQSVSIIPDDDSNGRVVYHERGLFAGGVQPLSLTPHQEAAVRDRVVGTLAGPLAEERMRGKLASEIQLGATSDYHQAVHLASLAVNDDEIEPYLAWLTVRSSSLVELWWLQIDAVAEGLLEHKYLHSIAPPSYFMDSMRDAG